MTLSANSDQIARTFRLSQALPWKARYNLAPTQQVPIVGLRAEGPAAHLARWGLIPQWAADASFGTKTFNARSETAAEKPSFRDAYRTRRCLVPCTGFYEWQARSSGKQPWFIRPRDTELFAFAGLWERWQDPVREESVISFTILTRDADAQMAPLHHRMPCILPNEDVQQDWLRGASEETPGPLPPAHAEGSLELIEVEAHVNRAGFDDPRCLQAKLGQDELF